MLTTKKQGQKENSIGQEAFKIIATNIPTIEIELNWGWDGNGKYNNEDELVEFKVNGEDYFIDCRLTIDEEGEMTDCRDYTMTEQSIEVSVTKVWQDEDLLVLSEKQIAVLKELIKDSVQTS